MKCKQYHSGFELASPCPFPTTITITARTPPVSVHSRCWSAKTGTSMRRDPLMNITDDLVLAFQAVSYVFCSSFLNGSRDRRLVAGQQLLCEVLFPEFVQYCSYHICAVPISFFSIRFLSVHVVYPYSSTDTIAAWKKIPFILLDRLDNELIDSLSISTSSLGVY